jgi:hypothetical protein
MGTGSLRVELGEILWFTSQTVGDSAGPRTLLSTGVDGEAKVKIGSIVVRCYEFDRMLAFWQQALGYEPREPEEDGWVVLKDPEGRGPNVSLDRVPEPLGKTSRCTWISTRQSRRARSRGSSGSGRSGTLRNTARTTTSSFWKIQKATASASFR